jgi:hypothetical protein
VRRVAVDRQLVAALHSARRDERRPLLGGQRAQSRPRRADPRPLDDAGRAIGLQGRDQGLADAELGDHSLGLERRVRAEGLGRRPHRMPLTAEHIPEDHRHRLVAIALDTELGSARGEFRVVLTRRADAREVALDVGGEHRHAGAREALGHDLQRHGLAGAGGAGNEPVPVGERQVEELRALALAQQQALRLHPLLRPATARPDSIAAAGSAANPPRRG